MTEMDLLRRSGTKFHKKVYLLAGDYTTQIGPGRDEFVPNDEDYMANERVHLEQLIVEAGKLVLKQHDPNFTDDESIVARMIQSGTFGNMLMPDTNELQQHRSAIVTFPHPQLQYIAGRGTEGACDSGGLALSSEVDRILAGKSDLGLVLGAEEQNNLLPIILADSLAGAAWIEKMRGEGKAFFFPGKLSERVDEYLKKYDLKDTMREAMTEWVVNMYKNAWLNPKAQMHTYRQGDVKYIEKQAGRVGAVAENLSNLDCSLITDAGAGAIVASYNGVQALRKKGIKIKQQDLVEICGMGEASRDMRIIVPNNAYSLETTRAAVEMAYESAAATENITVAELKSKIAYVELHDCFSNIGVMALEAAGLAKPGEGPEFVLDGRMARDGDIPVNATGGLIALGHPVGETGVRQAADIYKQLTGTAGANQVEITTKKPYALSINMGGDDGSVTAAMYRNANKKAVFRRAA